MQLLSTEHSALSTLQSRLLLAALLYFGSEVLAWTNPPGRDLLQWILLVSGYLALSAVLLDFIVRYRVRDLFGALILTGIYSLCAALVINPASMLNDLPRTLVTRVMGAHALLAAEMFGLFLVLTRSSPRSQRYLFIGCVVVGLAWGIWVKNWPLEEGFIPASLPALLAYGGGGLLLIPLLLYGHSILRQKLPSSNSPSLYAERAAKRGGEVPLRLSRRGWLLVAVVFMALLGLRLTRGEMAADGLLLAAGLLVLCWAILWFRGRKKGDTLLDRRFPVQPLPFPRFVLAAILFLVVGVLAYNLPPIQLGTITPYSFIGLGFTAYGLAWLPTVSLVLGIQGYLRQLATRQQ